MGSSSIALTIPDEAEGQRLDRALAMAAEAGGVTLSRSRISALLESGAVSDAAGKTVSKGKVKAGTVYLIEIPAPVDPVPQAEAIPLDVVHEDPDLIVVNKPAGMVVHPAPGAESGTLVNALLHHCGDGLAGIGGERRPGIVHRIDKDTSGLLVVAKTEAAMAGLSALFAAHDIERRYLALCWGAPSRADPKLAGTEGVGFTRDGRLRIETRIGRHPVDRKKMAVMAEGGRIAATYMQVRESFGAAERPFASLIACQLETGRTHQIRVHAAHIGHALIGDPVYGRARAVAARDSSEALRKALPGFPRQALHAAELGFVHPVSGKKLRFQSDFPCDMNDLLRLLRRNA